MDRLTQVKEEVFRRELARRMAAPLQANYGTVVEQPLPPRLQELMERLHGVFNQQRDWELTNR